MACKKQGQMKGIKLGAILLVLLCMAQSVYALEIFLKPGMNIYSDSIGIDAGLGVRTEFKNILGIFGINMENPYLFTGAGAYFSYADTEFIYALNAAVCVDFGYDFVLPILDNRLAVAPVLGVGFSYGRIEDSRYGFSDNYGLFLYPRAEATFAVIPSLKTGISVGYPMAIYANFISNIEVGLFVSYSFK
jgi:hypothetical protein